MPYAPNVYPLLLAELLVYEQLALYIDPVFKGGIVHAAGVVQRPAVLALALDEVFRTVRAHREHDGAGWGADEAAPLVLRTVKIMRWHGPCDELVRNRVETDWGSVPSWELPPSILDLMEHLPHVPSDLLRKSKVLYGRIPVVLSTERLLTKHTAGCSARAACSARPWRS